MIPVKIERVQIGYYVQNEEGSRIDLVTPKNIGLYATGILTAYGVPITHDILINNQFNETKNGFLTLEYEREFEKNNLSLSITQTIIGFSITLKRTKPAQPIIGIKDINFLHELQEIIFALFDEKLEKTVS